MGRKMSIKFRRELGKYFYEIWRKAWKKKYKKEPVFNLKNGGSKHVTKLYSIVEQLRKKEEIDQIINGYFKDKSDFLRKQKYSFAILLSTVDSYRVEEDYGLARHETFNVQDELRKERKRKLKYRKDVKRVKA